MPADQQIQLIDQLQNVCRRLRINTGGVLAVTIQRNRTSHFTSLIVDFPAQVILTHYPDPDALQGYRELQVGSFLIALKEDLPAIEITAVVEEEEGVPNSPFCCPNLQPFKPRVIALEKHFTDFLREVGNYPEVVFEVKNQIDGGALLSTTYWQLLQNKRRPIEGEFSRKMHAFKNYKCLIHNRFFGLDLYKLSNESGYNYHHMRMNPFTKVVPEVFEQFVREVEANHP